MQVPVVRVRRQPQVVVQVYLLLSLISLVEIHNRLRLLLFLATYLAFPTVRSAWYWLPYLLPALLVPLDAPRPPMPTPSSALGEGAC